MTAVQKGHSLGSWNDVSNLYSSARIDQLGGNRLRDHRPPSYDRRQAARRFYNVVSVEHDADKRDRVRVPVCPSLAVPHRWHHFARATRDCNAGALRVSPCWLLALDLCGLRFDCSLSQRVCAGRPGVHKDTGAEGPRANAVRAAIPGCAARGAGALCFAYHLGGKEISAGVARCLIMHKGSGS